MRGVALAAALLGCTGSPPADAPSPAPELGWVTTMVGEPSRFSTLMDTSARTGWIALHGHDHLTAIGAFEADPAPESKVGAQRSWLAEAALHDDLQRLVGKASDRLFSAWEARGALPPGAIEARALAARCAGMAPPTTLPEGWPALGSGPPDAAFVEALPPGPWRERLAAHVTATRSADELRALAAKPAVVVAAEGFERAWYDPCVHATLARAARAAAGDDPTATMRGWDDPAGSLFAPWLDAADLAAQLDAGAEPGAGSTRLEAALGLPAATPDTDDADVARAEIREADARLAAARARLLDGASDDAAALIEQIGALDQLRARVLTARARRDLRAGHARRALATTSMARDVTSRSVGPSNGPALIALLAEANLDTGRAREALDALQILVQARPEAIGAREIVGDLSILRGLDRHGDSKEQ